MAAARGAAGHAPGEDDKIRVTTQYPDYFPFMEYAERDDLPPDSPRLKAIDLQYHDLRADLEVPGSGSRPGRPSR